MDDISSRIEAIKSLLSNEQQRREKSAWTEVFESTQLSPAVDDPAFEHELLDLLKTEAADGYRRKDEILRTKKRRRGGYTPSQMHVTANIGRYIFAVMGWHNSIPGPNKHQTLVELSEAFNFQIDPNEIRLQQLSETERTQVLEDEEDKAYNTRNMAMYVAGFGALVSAIFYIIRRIG